MLKIRAGMSFATTWGKKQIYPQKDSTANVITAMSGVDLHPPQQEMDNISGCLSGLLSSD